tara:strand:+ start:243 stop:581 length:339 start_codon:yes stop_codon:yes gene_type:complete
VLEGWYNWGMQDKPTTYRVETMIERGLTQYIFSNGYTLSIGKGQGHYSNTTDNCEIAVIDPNDKFVPLRSYDDVIPYHPVSDIPSIIEVIKDAHRFKTHRGLISFFQDYEAK